MQKRHILVTETNGKYHLRELEAEIADGVSQFGIPTGKHYFAVESIHWIFYFMNCGMTAERADTIAEQLTQEFLAGNR